jgi:hypothetical protein
MENMLLSSAFGGYVMVLWSAVDDHVIWCPDKYELSSATSLTNPIKSDFYAYISRLITAFCALTERKGALPIS